MKREAVKSEKNRESVKRETVKSETRNRAAGQQSSRAVGNPPLNSPFTKGDY